MKAAEMIRYEDALEILGDEYEAALDCMWENNEFGDEICLADFMRAWTAYVDGASEYSM